MVEGPLPGPKSMRTSKMSIGRMFGLGLLSFSLSVYSLLVQMGWPEDWDEGIQWELEENHCRFCPIDRPGVCGLHHQSPINLERKVAIAGQPTSNECIDKHWMAYHDSTCDFDILQEAKAFTIERYALKIGQPVEDMGGDTYRLACHNGGRRWGRIDFSKGFSQWWHLSHIDFHVPSEHTQQGQRYDGEIHLYHFYSVSAEEAGVHNEVSRQREIGWW